VQSLRDDHRPEWRYENSQLDLDPLLSPAPLSVQVGGEGC
jgi:hypothetical protein